MVVAGSWITDTPNLFSASRWDRLNQGWLYLVVEATPDGSWDWAAWSSSDNRASLSGVACDLAEAIAQAERAAASISGVRKLAVA